MKRTIKILMPVIVFGILAYLSFSVINKMKHKNEVAKNLLTIPEFSFNTLYNSKFTNTHLKSDRATVFIYFNTECDFCQHEAESIKDNLALFKGIQLIMISNEPIVVITTFATTYNLLNQQNITFLYDSTDTFSNRFDANSIPFILIYDKNKKLLKKHKGQLKPEAILKILKD